MGIVPASQTVIGCNFGFDLSQVVLDVADFTFASNAGAPTTYWVGLQGLDSGGGVMYWETTSASPAGNETMYYDTATSVWAPQPGMDGVYAFGYDGYCNESVATIDLDCSNIGENSIDVSVTDAAGNEATCTATVIVSDVTAPVLVCGPDPLLYDNGSASDSPSTFFGNGTPLITSVINVTDDFTVSDINVDLNISHARSGDVAATLTSPAGTSVVLFQTIGSGAYGCEQQDIIVTLDDEATNPVVAACPANGAYNPENMLAAFDGENLMGDWTLTIEDTFPALDDGTLNSWSLNYEYSYPNPSTDLYIELDATCNYTIGLFDILILTTLEDACGIDVILTDVTDVDCSDIGTPIMVTVFANDNSGNFASCQYEVNVVDTMAPVLTCPGNLVEGATQTGTYTIPDYIAYGDTYATDNCTDAANITLTQTPAPGTVYGITVGTANPPVDVIFTATDAIGNESVCQFELEICDCSCSVVDSDSFNDFITLYPNPSSNKITIKNTSDSKMQKVLIYDVKGILLNQYMTNSLYDTLEIDVSNYQKGVYLVSIIAADQSKTVKRLLIK